MKKIIKYLVFSLLMLFGFSLNVKAETLPAAVDGKITLDKDYKINSVTFGTSSDVTVLDLNGKTLTINGTLKINKEFELKNGVVIRTKSQTSTSIIEVSSGNNGTVTIRDVVVDGIKGAKYVTGYFPYAGFGIYVNNNSSVIIDGVTLKDNYTGNNYGAGALNIQNANRVTVKNSIFYGNLSKGGLHECGAALYAENVKYLELINTNIHDNKATNVSAVEIINVEKFIMDKDTIIKNNEAYVAAGMHIKDSNAIISGLFENNKSLSDNGGAIYTIFTDNAYKDRVIKITETAKILNNESAFAGGGLYVNSDRTNIPGKVIINGATFSGNKALGTVDASDGLFKDIGGGAIAVARGILEINDIKMSGNTAAINKGNSIIVSHANGNVNGGKLTINGGSFDNSIDLGVGSILVNGGTFVQDMSKYITNTKLISNKTDKGYEVIENKVLEDDNITFENETAMDNNNKLVIEDKSELLKDKKLGKEIEEVISKDAVGEDAPKAKDVEVLALYDISVSDGTNKVEMKDGKFKITINLDEELLVYDNYAGIYIDDEGNVSYLPVEVEDGKATFETSHLSTYGVVGYNEEVEVPSEGGEGEAEAEVKNPETVVNVEMIISLILFGLMIAGIGISMKKQSA